MASPKPLAETTRNTSTLRCHGDAATVARGPVAALYALLAMAHGVACSRGLGPGPAVLNRNDPAFDEYSTEFTLPVPDAVPTLAPVVVRAGIDSVVRIELCSSDTHVVDGEEWFRAMRHGGLVAQLNSGGWIGNGPIAVRFRGSGIVGDVFANSDARGCRDYVFRYKLITGSERDLRWASRFGDVQRFGRCVRFFSADARFPFAEGEYSWGCNDH